MASVSHHHLGKAFTTKQGQYLAFIHLYPRLHRRPPAETDIQEYFRVSPPSVHQMVVALLVAGFVLGPSTRKVGETLLAISARTSAPPRNPGGRQDARY